MQGKKGTRGVRTYRERVWEQVHLSARIAKWLSATDNQLWSWYPQCLLMVLNCILIPPPQRGEERIQNYSLCIKHTENNKQICTAAYS